MQIELHYEASHIPLIALCVGGLGAVVGVAEWIITADGQPLLWAAGGLVLCVLGRAAWLLRPRAIVTESGARFIPAVFHGHHSFSWAQVRRWRWRSGVAQLENGEAEWKELVLVLRDGAERVIPEPYCHELLGVELARRVGAASSSGDAPHAELGAAPAPVT